MKIIGITGLPGSGKTEALEIFRSEGIPVFNMGDVITKTEAKNRGIKKLNESAEQEIRTGLRKKHGSDAVAMLTAKEVEKVKQGTVAIAGIHSFDEISYFRKMFGKDFIIVAIEADKKTRLMRLGKRKIRPLTKKEFEQREIHDRYDIPEIMENADFKANNNGTRDEFRKSVKNIIEAIL